MASVSQTNQSHLALRFFVVLLAYFLTGWVGLLMPFLNPGFTLIWVPSGIAVAALLEWGWIMSLPIFFGALALSLSIGVSLATTLPIAFGNVLAPCVCRYFLQLLPFHKDFSHRHDIISLALAAIVGMLLSATLGSFALEYFYPDVRVLWLSWWVGDTVGVLLATPLVLNLRRIKTFYLGKKVEEILIYTVFLCAVNWIIYLSPVSHLPLIFLMVPVAMWSALRFGVPLTTVAVFISSMAAVWATSAGRGPFVSVQVFAGLLVMWGYICTVSIASLMVAAMESEPAKAARDPLETFDSIDKVASRLPGLIMQYRIRPDLIATVPYISDGVQQMFEVSAERVRHDAGILFERVDPEDLGKNTPELRRATQALTPWKCEFRLSRLNGNVRWLYIDALPEREADGSTLWHCFITDITERKQAQQDLLIAAYTFESHEGIIVTDGQWRILRVNQAFTRISGYEPFEVMGKVPTKLKTNTQNDAFFDTIYAELHLKHYWHGELWSQRKNGETYPQALTLTALQDDNGIVTNYIATFNDNSRNKNYEDEIRNLAFYDSLTQLPNRRLLMDRLKHLILFASRVENHNAILFIDLDNFKTLNDTRGHDAGDLLLVETADRLRNCVRESDTVARLGGDEFVVVLEQLSSYQKEAIPQADMIGEKIRLALCQPYRFADFEHHGSCSIGICLFQGGEITVKDLFKRADTAMYEAKTSGRNAVRFFDPAMQAVLVVRMMMESNLRQAVASAQFKLFYQVQVNADGKLIGAEALLRWMHPERGFISPADFIPLAEETGIILSIGQWVLETACEQLKKWSGNPETAHLTLAVNVSAKQFQQDDFVDSVLTIMQRTGINPNRLKIELTESAVLVNVDDTTQKMLELKKTGVGFSMDDFGTGYSSLAYLQRLPLTQLKIDQSFVRDLSDDENDATIVRTIISLGVNLGLNVIAEGVETDAQRKFLIDHHCFAFQGYLFSKPLPLDAFEAMVHQDKLDHP